MTSTTSAWPELATRLQGALSLRAPPVAITFAHERPTSLPAPRRPVPAGCVFWFDAADRTFATAAPDHEHCSVGSLTHGFKTLDDVAGNDDVATLLESGWVTMDEVPAIPTVRERPEAVVYGPLADTPVDPDVVLLRVNAKQLMVLSDALPGLRIEGKPQCHIVAVAKEQGEPAASVGCALSRARTGMPATEMTCAIPAPRLAEVVEAVERTAAADATVARYAAQDAARYSA